MLALAVPLVVVVRVALSILSSRRVLLFVRRLTKANGADHRRGPRTATIIWAVEGASRCVPMATCLTQAIAAMLLVRLFGERAQFCLGVAPTEAGALRAHAWLECEGYPILGGGGIRSLVRLPDLLDRRQSLDASSVDRV